MRASKFTACARLGIPAITAAAGHGRRLLNFMPGKTFEGIILAGAFAEREGVGWFEPGANWSCL
jgi:hypothetical protein